LAPQVQNSMTMLLGKLERSSISSLLPALEVGARVERRECTAWRAARRARV
jgi:hypothetical protein